MRRGRFLKHIAGGTEGRFWREGGGSQKEGSGTLPGEAPQPLFHIQQRYFEASFRKALHHFSTKLHLLYVPVLIFTLNYDGRFSSCS